MSNNKGLSVLLAGLAIGAASVLKNKDSRDKALNIWNNTKSKISEYMNVQNTTQSKTLSTPPNQTLRDVAEAPAGTSTLTIDENAMVYEGGAQTTIFKYNEEQANETKVQ